MPAHPPESPPPPRPSFRWGRAAAWLIGGLLAGAVLALAAAHAPAVAKRLLLLPVVLGVLLGGGLRWLADDLGIARCRRRGFLAAALAASSFLYAGWISFGKLTETAEANLAAHPEQHFGLQMLEAAAARDATILPSLRERRRQLAPTFGDYLAFRVSQLGVWADPWPAVLWGIEALSAGAAAAWMFLRRTPAAKAADKPPPGQRWGRVDPPVTPPSSDGN